MKLADINLYIPNEHIHEMEVIVAAKPIRQLEIDRVTGEIISEIIPQTRRSFSTLNPDFFYLVLDGSIVIVKKNDSDITITNDYYNSPTFVNYTDIWRNWYNTPIKILMRESSKILAFAIEDETFPPVAVKALTLSNSSVDINTSNDSVVIVVGPHEAQGDHKGENHICHYRIGGPEDVANTIPSGVMTIKTSGVCHVVCVEKQ